MNIDHLKESFGLPVKCRLTLSQIHRAMAKKPNTRRLSALNKRRKHAT